MYHIATSDLLLLSDALTIGIVNRRLFISREKNLPDWWAHYNNPIDRRSVLINYGTIPNEWKEKYNLPKGSEVKRVLAERKKEQEEKKREQELQSKENTLLKISEQIEDTREQMKKEAYGKFTGYFNKIKEKHTLPSDRCREFAERWAVWVWILENYTRSHNSLEIYHAAYAAIFPKQFAGDNGKISFKNFFNKCREQGIEQTVIDQRAVIKVQKRRSLFQMGLLQSLYVQSRKITAADAYRKLVEACTTKGEKPMSHPQVKIIFREFEKNIDLYTARYGQGEAKKKIQYASFIPAEHRNSQWQADGKVLPFFVAGADGGGERWSVFLVQDNHSRMYVGYATGKTENTELILEGLNNAVSNTGVWPFETIMDRHSFHKTNNAAILSMEVGKMGGTITDTTDPQAKAMVERYNQNIDAIWKEFDGYLGQGIKARGKNARPSQEAINEIYKPKNYKTPDEIRALVIYAIEKYNNTPLAVLDGLTPKQKYEQSESKHAFTISDEDRARLFRPVKVYKVTRGQIIIKVGTVRHEFQLSAELYAQYNDETVEVRYEDLKDGIYLYDIKTGAAIDTVMPKRKIHHAKADQTDEDRRQLNQIAGRKNGTVTKARKAQEQQMQQTMKNNPEDIDLINYTTATKDIRTEIEKNRDFLRVLRIEGVQANNIPIREPMTAKVVVAGNAAESGGKSVKRPFAPVKNEIGVMSLDEILGINKQQ